MKQFRQILIGDLMVEKRSSIDPSRHPDEVFDLYSVPAFDSKRPETLLGTQIGSSKKEVVPGDLLLSRIVPHIRRAWVVGPSNGNRLIGSGEWMIFNNKHAWPHYLRHLLVSDWFHPKLMQTVSGVGGSLLRARPSEVAKIEIPLPPMAEQKRIAAILDKADAIRRKRQQALRLTDDFLRSVFLDMFGDPVTNPKGWETQELGDVSDQLTGFAFKSSEYVPAGSGIRLCRGANVLPDVIDWSDRVDWPDANNPTLQRYQLQKDDIIVALDRPWISTGFKIARITLEDVPALLVQRVARIRALEPYTNEFLYHLIGTEAFARHCKPTETTIPHISPRELRSFPVIVPPPKAIETFTSLCRKSASKRKKMTVVKSESEDLFASLQQRAFRGEL